MWACAPAAWARKKKRSPAHPFQARKRRGPRLSWTHQPEPRTAARCIRARCLRGFALGGFFARNSPAGSRQSNLAPLARQPSQRWSVPGSRQPQRRLSDRRYPRCLCPRRSGIDIRRSSGQILRGACLQKVFQSRPFGLSSPSTEGDFLWVIGFNLNAQASPRAMVPHLARSGDDFCTRSDWHRRNRYPRTAPGLKINSCSRDKLHTDFRA